MNAAAPFALSVGQRVHAQVKAAAIAHNLAHLKQGLRPTGTRPPKVWATVKADAYGHGLARVLPGLQEADGLAVMQLADAHACHHAGWRGPILVYGGLLDDMEISLLGLPDLHLVLTHEAQMDWLAQAGARYAPHAWLRFAGDIGLLGFGPEAYAAAYARCESLAARGCIAGIGHLNHYGRAEESDGIALADAAFRAAAANFPGPRSTSNSAALLRHDAHASGTDWIRPGLALYGASPLPGRDGASLGLRPAMSLHSRIIGLRDLNAGDRIGYNGAYTAASAMRVGLVGCGYADGYPRQAPAGTPVLVGGARSHTLGVISMDMMAVDISHLRHVEVGTPVVLWGTSGLPVEMVARAIGTIAADLLTGLTSRVPILAANG
jgi:alanine racemase